MKPIPESEHIIPHGKKRSDFNLEDWREVALECEAICSHQSISIIELSEKLNAQFATDAGGGNYTLKDHKEGDGVIRIYNSDGHIYCMYPYHLISDANAHLLRLNEKSPSTHSSSEMVEDKSTKKMEKKANALAEKVSGRYKGRAAEHVYFAVFDALLQWSNINQPNKSN